MISQTRFTQKVHDRNNVFDELTDQVAIERKLSKYDSKFILHTEANGAEDENDQDGIAPKLAQPTLQKFRQTQVFREKRQVSFKSFADPHEATAASKSILKNTLNSTKFSSTRWKQFTELRSPDFQRIRIMSEQLTSNPKYKHLFPNTKQIFVKDRDLFKKNFPEHFKEDELDVEQEKKRKSLLKRIQEEKMQESIKNEARTFAHIRIV